MRIKKSKLCLSIGTAILSFAALTTAHAAPQQSYQKGKTIGDDPFLKAVITSENMEPAIIHPAQRAAAQKKIDAYKQKTGRNPNVLIFIVDDMGWGDIGANGGRAAHFLGDREGALEELVQRRAQHAGGIGLAQRQVEHPGRGGREVGAHVQEQSEGPVAHTCDSGHGSRLANPN